MTNAVARDAVVLTTRKRNESVTNIDKIASNNSNKTNQHSTSPHEIHRGIQG